MKKTVILAVLGMAAGVASSYAQGSIQFNTYAANGSTSYVAKYGNGASAGSPVANSFTGELLYSLTPITDAASSSQAPLSAGWLVASTGSFATTGIPGTVSGPNFVLMPYTAGTPIYFEIAAFSGSSYANSLGVAGAYAGHTASFSQTLATGITGASPADGNPANGGSGFLAGSFNVYTVAVPEPTTLALAGLGGLASLVALRRKQA